MELSEIVKAFPANFLVQAIRDGTVAGVLFVLLRQAWLLVSPIKGSAAWHGSEAFRLRSARNTQQRQLAEAAGLNKALKANLLVLTQAAARQALNAPPNLVSLAPVPLTLPGSPVVQLGPNLAAPPPPPPPPMP
jgi:hypothetical protein